MNTTIVDVHVCADGGSNSLHDTLTEEQRIK